MMNLKTKLCVGFSFLVSMGFNQASFANPNDSEFDLLCKALPRASAEIKRILSLPLAGAWNARDHAILIGWMDAVTKSPYHDGITSRKIQIAYQKGECNEASLPTLPEAEKEVDKDFYECGGLGGVDEYRVGINLKLKKAAFSNIDKTAFMKLTRTEILESTAETKMIFDGPGTWGTEAHRLYFNLTQKSVVLYYLEKDGKEVLVGGASCLNAKPWGDLN